MSTTSRKRLAAERKQFRKEKPHGFSARPEKKEDGSQDLFKWVCKIPGKKGTAWEGASYTIKLEFPPSYPTDPPKAWFSPAIFHPNVFTNGFVCLTILKAQKGGWKPSLSVLQVLSGIQALLSDPNNEDPANSVAANLLRESQDKYYDQIREQARAIASRRK